MQHLFLWPGTPWAPTFCDMRALVPSGWGPQPELQVLCFQDWLISPCGLAGALGQARSRHASGVSHIESGESQRPCSPTEPCSAHSSLRYTGQKFLSSRTFTANSHISNWLISDLQIFLSSGFISNFSN